MKRILVSLLITTIALAGATSLSAQDMQKGMGKGHTMPMFSDCDLNGDGVISAEEFYEARSKRMAERAPQGGKMKNAANAPSFEISEEEFDLHKVGMMEKRQQRMQSNQEIP